MAMAHASAAAAVTLGRCEEGAPLATDFFAVDAWGGRELLHLGFAVQHVAASLPIIAIFASFIFWYWCAGHEFPATIQA